MRAIVLDKRDTVAVSLEHIPAGSRVKLISEEDSCLLALEDIPPGHKLALEDLPAGHPILKYGEVIGQSTQPISRGQHVHSHNLESRRGRSDSR